MGTTIYGQLPGDYNRKFYGRMSIEDYEHDHAVQLRQTMSWWQRIRHRTMSIVSLDHLNVDQLLDLGILQCADVVERVEMMAVIREPMEWIISHCNQYQDRSIEDEIAVLRQSPNDKGFQTTKWLRFEYEWNVTVFTMESRDQITEWINRFGIDVRFDRKHRRNRRAQNDKTCKIEDISKKQLMT